MKLAKQYKWYVTYTTNTTQEIIASYVETDKETVTFWNTFIEQKTNSAKYTHDMIAIVKLCHIRSVVKGKEHHAKDDDIHY